MNKVIGYGVIDVNHIEEGCPLFKSHSARYVNDTLALIGITEEQITHFDETVRIDAMGWNPNADEEDWGLTPTALSDMVDSLMSGERTGKLIVLSKAQGKWLSANHVAFKQVENEEIA